MGQPLETLKVATIKYELMSTTERDDMPEVGVRQLRNHLSEYLRSVRDGQELTVTDHGRAVARIIPIDQPRLLDRLIEDGTVTPARSKARSLPNRRVRAKGPVSPLVADQRE